MDTLDSLPVGPTPAMPEAHRLAPAIGVFKGGCICAVFWALVELAAFLLA
jgi:hypothetical protein